MTPEQEKVFKDRLEEALETGVKIGMKTVSRIIYDKIKKC